nr:unnamed protein product [Callosobruchus chinensis]
MVSCIIGHIKSQGGFDHVCIRSPKISQTSIRQQSYRDTGIRRCSSVCQRHYQPGRSANCNAIQPQNFKGGFGEGSGN